MEIIIPRSLDFRKSIDFCRNINNVSREEEKYTYNYERITFAEPFGMLIVGSTIRQLVEECSQSEHRDINFRDKDYLANVGFFYSVRQEFGKHPNNLTGNSDFIPIKKVNIRDSYRDALNEYGSNIVGYIDNNISEHIASVISRGNEQLKICLKFCITEVIRNVYDHSDSKELWYAGQFWPSRDLVEIAIIDEGIGIKESLKRNKKISASTDNEAIEEALKPGVSKRVINPKNTSVDSNQGFGLYMIRSICEQIGGLTILSGNSCFNLDRGKESSYVSKFNGTAIRIRIKPSLIVNARHMIEEFSKQGSQQVHKIN